MRKILIIIFAFSLSHGADEYDVSYACKAFEKRTGEMHQKLDMRESLAKGGYFSLSVKINFPQAIVSLNKDTVNNIDYEDMRFAYRASVMDFDMYVYKYNKDFFSIEKGNKAEPKFSMKLKNGYSLYYLCTQIPTRIQ